MTVDAFVTGDRFVLRVIKHHVFSPLRKWANSYEFEAIGAGSEPELLALGLKTVNFEIALHSVAVEFERLIISTWEADSVPYNPAAFISTTLTGVGTRSTSGDLLGLHNTLAIARPAASGRFGHLFYRGFLVEADVEAPAGTTVLTAKSAVQTEVEAALSSSSLGDTLVGGGDPTFTMVLINKAGTNVRPVQEFLVQGVSQLPVDHAWFNRT